MKTKTFSIHWFSKGHHTLYSDDIWVIHEKFEKLYGRGVEATVKLDGVVIGKIWKEGRKTKCVLQLDA